MGSASERHLLVAAFKAVHEVVRHEGEPRHFYLEQLMTTKNLDDINECAQQLARSDKGRGAMLHLLAWLDDDGLSLDVTNQLAVIGLLEAAWGGYAGSARDAMRVALGSA